MRAFVFFLAIAGCAPRAAVTPVPTGTLGGVVLERMDGEERPLAGRQVDAVNLTGNVVATTMSDPTGRFTFTLPEGKYRIRTTFDDGFVADSEEEVRSGNLGPSVHLARVVSRPATPFPITPTPVTAATPSPSATPFIAIRPNVPAGHGQVRGVVGYHHSSIDFTALPDHTVTVARDGKTVQRILTDARGAFVLVLPAGVYQLSASLADAPPSIQPRTATERVDVPDGRSIEVNLMGSDGTR